MLEKYAIGLDDRFAHQVKAQLNALIKERRQGIQIVPVWNKSRREHVIIKPSPQIAREKADHQFYRRPGK